MIWLLVSLWQFTSHVSLETVMASCVFHSQELIITVSETSSTHSIRGPIRFNIHESLFLDDQFCHSTKQLSLLPWTISSLIQNFCDAKGYVVNGTCYSKTSFSDPPSPVPSTQQFWICLFPQNHHSISSAFQLGELSR